MKNLFAASAYGGAGWSPRASSLRQEIGSVWATCGVATEWSPLKAVLLHSPGPELDQVTDPEQVQMLAPLEAQRARQQHLRGSHDPIPLPSSFFPPVKVLGTSFRHMTPQQAARPSAVGPCRRFLTETESWFI